jgi:hypothetical protein
VLTPYPSDSAGEIPLLRFKTNGSGEREKIVEMLDKLV